MKKIMKKIIWRTQVALSCIIVLPMLFMAGCSSLDPGVTRQGVSTLTRAGLLYNPKYEPAIRIAGEAICAAANGTNVSPAAVIAQIHASETKPLEPGEALLIDGILMVYTGVWNFLGADQVANSPDLKLHLQATCEGIRDVLPAPAAALVLPAPAVSLARKPAAPPRYQWPLVRSKADR